MLRATRPPKLDGLLHPWVSTASHYKQRHTCGFVSGITPRRPCNTEGFSHNFVDQWMVSVGPTTLAEPPIRQAANGQANSATSASRTAYPFAAWRMGGSARVVRPTETIH